jgi:hypothetical protein
MADFIKLLETMDSNTKLGAFIWNEKDGMKKK